MKKINYILILIFVFGFYFTKAETTNFIVDRYLFVSGETLNVFGSIIPSKNELSSKIVYCDLVSPNTEIISTSKYEVFENKFHAQLKIPEYVISSVYMLRVYTKYMRNSKIKYTYIKIVNPDNKQYLEAKNIIDIVPKLIKTDTNLVFNQDMRSYKKEDIINIELNQGNYFASYLPEKLNLTYGIFDYENNENYNFKKEIDNFTIQGSLQSVNNSKTANQRISLSIIGEANYLSVYTDSLSNFSFNVFKYYGEKSLYINSMNNSKVVIYSDFAIVPIGLKFPEFEISEEEKYLIIYLANNYKIEKQFINYDSIDFENINSNPFYYIPDEIVYLHDYVDMENLIDYFNEIPGLVNVKKTKEGGSIFKIRSAGPKIQYYPPLVMVNFMEINDNEKILNVSPELIERIEIINSVYIKDDFLFGGIINFITKDESFDNKVFSNSSIIFNYNFINDIRYYESDSLKDYPFDISSHFNSSFISDNNKLKFKATSSNSKFNIVIYTINDKGEIRSFKREIIIN